MNKQAPANHSPPPSLILQFLLSLLFHIPPTANSPMISKVYNLFSHGTALFVTSKSLPHHKSIRTNHYTPCYLNCPLQHVSLIQLTRNVLVCRYPAGTALQSLGVYKRLTSMFSTVSLNSINSLNGINTQLQGIVLYVLSPISTADKPQTLDSWGFSTFSQTPKTPIPPNPHCRSSTSCD